MNSVASSLSMKMMLMFGFIASFLFGISYAKEYHTVTMPVKWELAEKLCHDSEKMLIPDMSDEIESTDLYSALPVGKFVWINAKSVQTQYPNHKETIKFAYKPVDTKLKYYLCKNEHQSTRRKKGKTLSTWVKALQLGEGEECDLLNVSTADNVKSIVSLLEYNQATWVNKNTDNKLPHSVLNGYDVKCLGMSKQSDGSVSVAVDDCAHKHMYICVDDKNASAPTLTRLKRPLPVYVHPPETGTIEGINETAGEDIMSLRNERNSDSGGLNGGKLAGVIVGAVTGLLIILSMLGVLFYRKRRLNRQAYKTSLRNYRNRQNSRRIDTGTFNRDTQNSVNSTENAGGDKSYQQCQKDVVDECKRRSRERYISGPVAGNSSSVYQSNVGYQLMVGKKQVDSYEGYNPDVAHLQNIHGYINGPSSGPQTVEQYEVAVTGKAPKLPKKKKKKNTLNDHDQYEDPSRSANEPVRLDDLDQYENEELKKSDKHLNKPKGNSVNTLEDLDSYENYQLPKRRERGKFGITKSGNNAVNSPKKSHASKNNSEYSMAKTIDDPESYENFESPYSQHKEQEKAYVDDGNYYDL